MGAQGPGMPGPVSADPLSGVSPRTFTIMCYIPLVGWIASVIVLGSRRFRKDLMLRFHAFQGLYIFAAWLLVDWAISPMFDALPRHVFRLDHLLQAILIGVWIFMIIKTSHGQVCSLPLIGELAHRSANERQGL